jgi:peptidoglycan/xylan/chitin deacetylase (PgdA/CDA1 family)/SH3-like domain-containing protein
MSRSTLTIFILICAFGVLFTGCGAQPEPTNTLDEFTFSDTDLQKVQQMAQSSSEGTATVLTDSGSIDETVLSAGQQTSTSVLTETVTPDKQKQALYDSLRVGVVDQGGNAYRVNNPFLNVRQSMNVSSPLVAKLDQGALVTVLDIPTAEWAQVKMTDGKEGYVAFRYLAKPTTDARLPAEKKQFEGKFFVDFAFLNVRKDPSAQSEKVGELPGQAIVKPLSMNGEWARVTVDGKEGYVSTQYLKPFQPLFLVRQDEYLLPILRYVADDSASLSSLVKQVAALKAAGKKVTTLKILMDTVLAQERSDTRVPPDAVVLMVDAVTGKNVKQVSDALQAAGVGATLFLETKDVGLSGITEKTILNLMANGNDLQSAGHTGDDLRSMTDSQVALELGQSKKLIEDITHKEVYAVSYARGGVNDRVMQQAAQMGYLFGLGQSPDKQFTRSQFLRLPTLLVTSGMSEQDIVKLVK